MAIWKYKEINDFILELNILDLFSERIDLISYK